MDEHAARRWNLSAERLYVDCWTRAVLAQELDPASCSQTCNVGIGFGEWDDWLGYWLQGHGQLVSVDIDEQVVRALSERQHRESHPNPARAVHADLLQAELGPFDLVTVVGSTVHETHAPIRALRCARRWVRPGGWLYATVLHGMGDPELLLVGLPGIQVRRTFQELPGAELTVILTRC